MSARGKCDTIWQQRSRCTRWSFLDNRRLAFSDFHNDTEKIRELESGKNLIEETCASAATVRKLISRSVASIVAEPLAPVALRSHFSLVRSASDPQHYLVHVFAPQM